MDEAMRTDSIVPIVYLDYLRYVLETDLARELP